MKFTFELVNVIMIANVVQRTIVDVSFPFQEQKSANNLKTVQVSEDDRLHTAAILFLFALITHDPLISAKFSTENHL